MARILITDDSTFMRNLIDDILIEEGHEVFHAADGQEMLAKFEEIHPDLVLLDIVMPVMDGMSAIDRLRSSNPDAKIVMCTAQGQKILRDEAFEKGACAYIEKPFGADQILDVIRDALK